MLLALLRVASLILVLYLPGLLWRRAFYRRSDGLPALYEELVIGALWSGWLALLLAVLGIFSLPLHVALTLAFAALGILVGRRSRVRVQGPDPASSRSERLLYAAVLILFGVLVARPFETVLGSKDAGVYANTGYAIARTGGIVLYDPVVVQIARDQSSPDERVRAAAAQAETNFLGTKDRTRWLATRYRHPGFFLLAGDMERGRVVPQFFHLYPAWIALFTSALGLKGGLAATGYLALLGLWSVGLLGRRLAGRTVGILALLFLAFNTAQVWFARYTTSEAAAQFLLFAGLAAFAAFAGLSPDQRRSRAGVFYGVLAGAALGQLALNRIDFFWGVGPALVYLIYVAVSRRWSRGHTAFALALGAMLIHAGLHIFFIARAYFIDTGFARFQDFAVTARLIFPLLTPPLQHAYLTNTRSGPLRDPYRIWLELAVLLGLVLALWVLWRRWRLVRAFEQLAARWRPTLLLASALTIFALASYAYLIRPRILTPEVLAHPLEKRLVLEGYIGAPVPIPREAFEKEVHAIAVGNMVRLGWYLSPLGIVLGVAGFLVWWLRGLDRRSWMFLAVALLSSAFYIRDLYGTSDQHYIYILRRFIPAVFPGFSLAAAYAVAVLWRSRRVVARGLATSCAAALLLFFLATGWRSFVHVEYGGALEGLGALAARVEPESIILVRGGGYAQIRDIAAEVATPLTYAFDRNALVVTSPEPARYAGQLSDQVRHWMRQGRSVYLLLGSNGGSLLLPGLRLERLDSLALHLAEWQQLRNQKPKLPAEKELHYILYRVHDGPPDAAGAAVSLTPSDYAAQVAGFYRVEQDPGGPPYAWIAGGRLRLPPFPTDRPATLTLRLGAGKRPGIIGTSAKVCPSLAAGPLGERPLPVKLPCLDVGPQPADYTLQLPPLNTSEPLLLSLDGPTWTPSVVTAQLPESERIHDGRELLVQFYGLLVSASPHGG